MSPTRIRFESFIRRQSVLHIVLHNRRRGATLPVVAWPSRPEPSVPEVGPSCPLTDSTVTFDICRHRGFVHHEPTRIPVVVEKSEIRVAS